MPNDYTPYIQRHLARNVPLNFSECCNIVRSEQEVEKRVRYSSQDEGYKNADFNRIYKGMVEKLVGDEPTPELEKQIGEEIFAVDVRFEVIQRTIDYNIPAKPFGQAIGKLKTTLSQTIRRLNMDTQNQRERSSVKNRDQNVRFFLGLDDDEKIPNTIDDFRHAKSISEKAAIANSLLIELDRQLEEISGYFDYKMGLVTAGQPSVFATLYAVHALGQIFETYSSRGLKASVGMDPSKGGGIVPNEYTGEFLDFSMRFFHAVDYSEVRRNEGQPWSESGMHALIRKHAKSRKKDPEMHKLLHGQNVDHLLVLEFMKRADAIK
jgi:hypothetical protein